MTVRQFITEVVGSEKSQGNVTKWESKNQDETGMVVGTEYMIRMYILKNVIESKNKNHHKFFELFQKAHGFLKSKSKPKPIFLDESFA